MLYKSVFKSLTSLRGLFSGYLGAGRYFVRAFAFFAFAVFVSGFSPSAAFAAEVNEVAQSMVSSASGLPGLLAALSYLMGLILGITGLLKLKDHVENPTCDAFKNTFDKAFGRWGDACAADDFSGCAEYDRS